MPVPQEPAKTRVSRRQFVGGSLACLSVPPLAACGYDPQAYHEAAAEMRRALPRDARPRDLLRYATLAANGHNTQPWLFKLGPSSVDILPDFSRHTPVVDPDNHHLFASLGCAGENLHLAARARAMDGGIEFDASKEGRARVDLKTAPAEEGALFAAIPHRQCSRAIYDARAVAPESLQRLHEAANSYGVETVFITDIKGREDILALVLEGNSRQVGDPAFVAELKQWVRFNADQALAEKDGLYSAASGNPELPRWIAAPLFSLFFDKETENDKYAEQIRSSAGIAVFVAGQNTPEGWFNAGRAYQRFALQSTAEGLKNAFINQAVEVPALRGDLQALLGLGARRPNLVVRFGYGPSMPSSLRRPVDRTVI